MKEYYRVLQLTDTHLYPEDYENGFGAITALTNAADPDLAVFTGDNFFGKDGQDARFYRRVADFFAEKGIKWAALLGNHDGEYNSMSRREIVELVESLPASVVKTNPIGKRYGNFFVDTPFEGVSLAMLDSGNYATLSERIRSRFSSPYAALTDEQIAFYKENAAGKKAVFVYLHIPLNEYLKAYYLALANGKVIYGALRENISSDGSLRRRGDVVCSPAVNTGFFEAARSLNNLKAVFAGHDHLNDFAAEYKGVTLVFGQRSYSDPKQAYGFAKRGFTDFSGGTVADIFADGSFKLGQLFLKDL